MGPLAAHRDRFNRWVLPGLAFKAVVIGGGYATGRELVEFFLPSGPVGGLLAMLLAAAAWSAVCVLTFLFARLARALDYQAFFGALLGRFAVLFEAVLVLFAVLTLSVFGAAAGAIGAALFGWPVLAGTAALGLSVLAVVSRGSGAVEGLFKYVSVLLYGVYAVFLVLCVWRFGGGIAAAFHGSPPASDWVGGGLTYAGYNVVGAVLILAALRHQRDGRDAVVSGLLCGPLAMTPAIVFFVCLTAFAPQVRGEALPSDFLLRQLHAPAFHVLFQLMIFAALLECSAGSVHAINERIAAHNRRHGRADTPTVRLVAAALLLLFAMGVAGRVGLVALISQGYRFLAWVVLAVFVAPLATVGVARLIRGASPAPALVKAET